MKILMLENIPLGGEVKIGSHHYASRFVADGHDVMFVPLPGHLFSLLGGSWGKLRHVTPVRARRVVDGLREIVPFTFLPWRESFLARAGAVYAAQPLLAHHALLMIAAHGFRDVDMVWITDPRWEWALRFLRYRRLVYRRCDSFGDFSDVPAGIDAIERRLMAAADVVFYTDVSLAPADGGTNAVLLNNACEFEKFNVFAARREVGPAVRIGFTGALGEWFDVQTVAAVARELGDRVAFDLWGPVRTDVSALAGLPNVTVHGPIPYAELSRAYDRADALIIPFRQNELGSTINPIKLYEGLATGRPVIVPDLPNLRALGAPLRHYRTAAELAEIVRALHAQRVIEVDPQAVAFGRANSWTARAKTVLDTLGGLR
jgi:glycosyltransferase involved in cell wall biosynthesis